MQKKILILAFALAALVGVDYCADTARLETATVEGHSKQPRKLSNFERLQINFADLQKFTSVSDKNRAEFNQKLATVKKLIDRLKSDINPKVTEIKIATLDLEKQLLHVQSAQCDIPSLPEKYATRFYPQQDECGIRFIHLPAPDSEKRGFDQITQLPQGFSPDRGWVIVNNGLIKKYMTDPRLINSPFFRLAKLLFTISQEGNVVRTALPSNPAISLNPTTVAQLIRLLYNNLLSQEAITDFENNQYLPSFVNSWYQAQLEVPGEHDTKEEFIKECKKILKAIATCTQKNRELTTDFLLAVVALEIERGQTPLDSAEVFQEYTKGLLGKEMPIRWYSEVSPLIPSNLKTTTTDQLSFFSYVIASLKDAHHCSDIIQTIFFASEDVRATYQGNRFACCSENTLRTIISLLFFDSKTGILSLDAIPEELRPNISQELISFIENHANPLQKLLTNDQQKEYQNAATDAWIQLVENRPGIAYSNKTTTGEKYDICTFASNIILILTELLGIPIDTLPGTPAQQFIALIEKFSTNNKSLQVKNITESSTDQTAQSSFLLTAANLNLTFKISFSERHASVINIYNGAIPTKLPIYELFVLGKATGQFLLGTTRVELSTLLETIFSTQAKNKQSFITTKDELQEFFLTTYSNSFWGSLCPQIFYTSNFYSEVVYTVPSVDLPTRTGLTEKQHALITETITALGFTNEGALEEALATNDVLFATLVLIHSNCSLAEKNGVKILEMISENDTRETIFFLEELTKRHFDFTKTYSFEGKEETPLLWACSQKKPYLAHKLVSYLQQSKYQLTAEEAAKVFELFKETNFTLKNSVANAANPYTTVVDNLSSSGFNFNTPLPFSNGACTLLDWALNYRTDESKEETLCNKSLLLNTLFRYPLLDYNPSQVVGLLETIAQDIPTSCIPPELYTGAIIDSNPSTIDFSQQYPFKEGLFTPLEWLEYTKASRSPGLHEQVKKEIDYQLKRAPQKKVN